MKVHLVNMVKVYVVFFILIFIQGCGGGGGASTADAPTNSVGGSSLSSSLVASSTSISSAISSAQSSASSKPLELYPQYLIEKDIGSVVYKFSEKKESNLYLANYVLANATIEVIVNVGGEQANLNRFTVSMESIQDEGSITQSYLSVLGQDILAVSFERENSKKIYAWASEKAYVSVEVHDLSDANTKVLLEAYVKLHSSIVPQKKSILTLTPLLNHEDTAVHISVNLIEDSNQYTELGYMITKENGMDYHPVGGDSALREVIYPVSSRLYGKITTGLKPSTEYEICLNGGWKKEATQTGNFDCKTFKTYQKKKEVAAVLINYDVEPEALLLIDKWISVVSVNNPELEIKYYTIQKEASPEQVLDFLQQKYRSANLAYVVFIGDDLPAFKIDSEWATEKIPHLGAYSALSAIKRGLWLNESATAANEVAIAAIRARPELITSYFHRLLSFYNGERIYSHDFLMADAMVPAEKSVDPLFFSSVNLAGNMVAGITDYSDTSEASLWQKDFSNKLFTQTYGLMVINAHGNYDGHLPCAETCIDNAFIKTAKPKVKIILGISCQMGNLMMPKAPMTSYIFEADSLVGLGAEFPYIDRGGLTTKSILKDLYEDNKTVGEAGRYFGFLIAGDPFLKAK